MPTRLCTDCRTNPATYRGRCTNCNRTNQATIQRAGHTIYRTARWQRTRRHVLHHNPLCAGYPDECGAIATDVDHIVSLDQGGDPWAPTNLQGLCHTCHGRKTRAEQISRTRGV